MTDKLVAAIASRASTTRSSAITPTATWSATPAIWRPRSGRSRRSTSASAAWSTRRARAGGEVLITADHGNAEQMYDAATGQPHTAHTLNRVPCVYAGRAGDDGAGRRAAGHRPDAARHDGAAGAAGNDRAFAADLPVTFRIEFALRRGTRRAGNLQRVRRCRTGTHRNAPSCGRRTNVSRTLDSRIMVRAAARSARCRRPAGDTAAVTIDFSRAPRRWRRQTGAYTVANRNCGCEAWHCPARDAKERTMGNWKKAGLIGLGAVLGVLLSLNFSAIAQREARMPDPLRGPAAPVRRLRQDQERLRRAGLRRQAHQGSDQRHGARARPALRFPRRRSLQGPADLDAGQVRRPRHRGRRRGRHRPRRLADRGHARVPRRHQVRRPHRQDRRRRHARHAARPRPSRRCAASRARRSC